MSLFKRLRRPPAGPPADPETAEMSLGKLMQAALNIDLMLTAGDQQLSQNDRAYLAQQAKRVDGELERRGHRRYSDL